MSLRPGVLRPYVPRLLREWLVQEPDLRWREVDGTLALADVSGFTRLSERLARRGRIGAEELADVIDGCFTELLRLAYLDGGSLLKFGGDALLLLFNGDDHAARACRATVGMRRTLRELGGLPTAAGPLALRMSVGVHSGTLQMFLSGRTHRELVVAGPAVTEAVRMEADAGAGEILISGATAAVVPGHVLGRTRQAGRLLSGAPPGSPRGPETPPAVDESELLVSIPTALRERLTAGDQEPEHRRVTVAFLRFQGVDAYVTDNGPQATSHALEELVGNVQAAVDRHQVSFLGTDVDRDGGKIVLASGAPATDGQHEERMLLALRTIVTADQPFPLHVGLHTGHVFAGEIGPTYRRTYTVMGDVVNLAARLATTARPGEVIATRDVLNGSRTTFTTTGLEPFTVKGRRQPVDAVRVGSITGSRATWSAEELPFVGRETEFEVFDRAVAAARNGHGCAIEIVGEAGIGKTRLLDAFRRRDPDLDAYYVLSELHRASSPYGPIRALLRRVLDVPEEADDAETTARLMAILHESLPELVDWAPLLGIPLGLDLPATEATANLHERFRRPRLQEAVIELLRWSWPRPVLIAVEDVQWLDEASADLLRTIASRLDELPWILCVTGRDRGGWLTGDTTCLAMDLDPLDATATTRLADAATEAAPLPQHEMTLLVEHSGGNPLFLQELVAAARETGGVDKALPDSVRSLVTARIDRLPEGHRRILRQLSTLGYRFDRRLAAAVLPDHGEDALVGLDDFLADDGATVRFRHTLIREVAYEGLPFRIRRRLHATVGDTIATTGVGQDDLLSYHYFLAGRHRDAWHASARAGADAAAIYANAEAARFYERALDAGRRLDDLDPTELARVSESLGDVLRQLGEAVRAAAVYRDAQRACRHDAVASARLRLKQARVQSWLKRYSQALGAITRGLSTLEGRRDRAARAQRSQLMVWYAHFRQEQGKHTETVRWSRLAIAEAEASGEKDALAHAYKLLDWVHTDLGQLELATHAPRALELYEELGDLASQATVLNNMGIVAYLQGRWDEARRLYERALELHERTGDAVQAAMGRNNIAEIGLDQGRLQEAEQRFREAARVFRAASYRSGISRVTANLGRVAARDGRFDEALKLLERARVAWRDLGAEAETIEADARTAECLVLRGDPDAALIVATEASRRSAARGGTTAQDPLLHRVRGYAHLQRGELDAARAALEQALAAAEARDADYECALTRLALAELVRQEGSASPGDLVARSRAVLDDLGVRWLPAVPMTVGAAATATSSPGHPRADGS